MEDKDLKAYGYAPGRYMMLCPECGKTASLVAAHTQRCRACAEKIAKAKGE